MSQSCAGASPAIVMIVELPGSSPVTRGPVPTRGPGETDEATRLRPSARAPSGTGRPLPAVCRRPASTLRLGIRPPRRETARRIRYFDREQPDTAAGAQGAHPASSAVSTGLASVALDRWRGPRPASAGAGVAPRRQSCTPRNWAVRLIGTRATSPVSSRS